MSGDSHWDLVAFDLDDTLAPSKSALPKQMAVALRNLLDQSEVAVISGGALPQFQMQLLDGLGATLEQLSRLHLLPTCGTQYLRFQNGELTEVYSRPLSQDQREDIERVLIECAQQLGLWQDNPWGDIIEDRGSQITFSALGQQAPLEEKAAWDPTGEKKNQLAAMAAQRLPDLEVRSGGSTSVDVTSKSVDKAYGMNALLEATDYDKSRVLFIGDRLDEAGNDFPVKAAGFPTRATSSWEETVEIVNGLTGAK